MQKRIGLSFPEEVLEHVFSFIHHDKDRNSVSLVCKSWYEIERWCRRRVFIGNCYAVSPATVIRRFPKVRSVELKGKPHFADFNLVPEGWGGYVYPWIEAMSKAYTWLEEIRLKRMVVSDECLELIAKSFKNFKVLVLSSCDGFSTDGLAAIASTCRNLKELDLRESDVDDVSGHWLSHFPDTYTSLVSLNISCLASDVCFSALERLVSSINKSALNGSRLTSEQKGKQKMGHTDEKKPSQQPNMCGPKFESTAQRLCIGNEEKSSKSIVQEQKMTSAKGASVLKLANRFSALDLENVHD